MTRRRRHSPARATDTVDAAAAYAQDRGDPARERRWQRLAAQPKMMQLGLLGTLISFLQPSSRHQVEASRREEALKVDDYENAGPGSRPDYSKARIRIDRRSR